MALGQSTDSIPLTASTIAQPTLPETITLALEDIAPSSAGILLEPDLSILLPGGPAATLGGEVLSLLPSFDSLVIDGTTYPLATATTWSATTADVATDATTTVLATRTAQATVTTATPGSARTTVAAASLAPVNATAATTTLANATAQTASGGPVLVAGNAILTSASETLSFSFLSHSGSAASSSARTSLSLPSVSFVVPGTSGIAGAGSAWPTSTGSGAGIVRLPLDLAVGCIGLSLVILRVVGL